VQASLLETALVWNAQKADAFATDRRDAAAPCSGHPSLVPYEAFDAADGPLLICCGNDRLFAKLARNWATRTGAPTRASPRIGRGLANKAALFEQLCPLLRAGPRDLWIERFEAVGVPCSPILTVPEVLRQPQVKAMGLSQPVPGDGFSLTGLPLSFDGVRPGFQRGAPRLGADNEAHGMPAATPKA
jgi:crotonobetainyl-CoA:carnitine CoA-transferase CaiB-like acyl-CoA transferase